MHHSPSPVLLALSRQDETQQMATFVNFGSDYAPLEDLIIWGLYALFLIFYINTVINIIIIFVIVTASLDRSLLLYLNSKTSVVCF